MPKYRDDVVIAVRELLVAGALCFDCLVTQAELRSDDVSRELDTLRATLAVGRCAACTLSAPVFSIGVATTKVHSQPGRIELGP
jgi:hypothetical protein